MPRTDLRRRPKVGVVVVEGAEASEEGEEEVCTAHNHLLTHVALYKYLTTSTLTDKLMGNT